MDRFDWGLLFGAAFALVFNYGAIDGRWEVGCARATSFVLGALLWQLGRVVWRRWGPTESVAR